MKNIASIFKKSVSPWLVGASLAATLGLAACGGGGGSGSGVAEPVTPPAQPPVVVEPLLGLNTLQGRWATANNDLVARWLPPVPGQTTAPIWMLSQDGQSLTVLNATVSGSTGVSAKGKRYAVNTPEVPAVAIDWQGTSNVKSSPATLSFVGGPNLSLTSPLKDAVLQLNAVGQWRANLGLTTLDFDVDALGIITGQSQTGCLYVGVITARTDVSVYEVKLSETCPSNAVEMFSGIAILSSSAAANLSQLTLALVSVNGDVGKALYFNRK